MLSERFTPRFRRLLAVRWTSQTTDGLYQSALATYLLFSPERQTSATAAALAFTVMLLPYSLVGPFVGTILDRFPRRRIIATANIFRAINLIVVALLIQSQVSDLLLTVVVLTSFGANRLILAGLSAGLPLVINRKYLIESNAIAVTGGAIGIVFGGAIGFLVRRFVEFWPLEIDVALIILAALGYLTASLLALRLELMEIGPHEHEMLNAKRAGVLKTGLQDFTTGFSHLRSHHDAVWAISAVAVQRGGVTALTLMGLLLERNTFNSSAEGGLAGVAALVSAAGIGFFCGALFAPFVAHRIGRHRTIKFALVAAAIPIPFFGITSHVGALIVSFLVGAFGQAMKVTADALIQQSIADEYRGRVFAFYDVAVNLCIVTGALLAAIWVDDSGRSVVIPIAIPVGYLVMAAVFGRRSY